MGRSTIDRIGAILVSLAVPLGDIVVAIPGTNEPADELTYLKNDGDHWWRVVRRGRTIRSREPLDSKAVESAIPSIATTPATGNYLKPYVAYPVGSWPEAVAIGDLNHDGRKDVALVTSFYFDPADDYSLFVFLQNGIGELQASVKYPVGGSPNSVDIGDVNGDGLDDVVIGREDGIFVLLQNANGTLNPGTNYPTNSSRWIRIGDFNSDGQMDVAGIDWATSIVVFTQQPNGTLALAASYTGTHQGFDDLEVGDLNGDGRDDLVVMSGQGLVPNASVFLQQPAGLFSTAVPADLPGNDLSNGIGLGDLTGDGRSDLAVSYGGNSPNAHVAIWRQNGGGTLDLQTPLASYDIPEPVAVGDVNFDGRRDVVVAHGGWLALGVYRQQVDGTLASEDLFPLPYASHYNSHGLAVGDIDGDGANDVVIADYNAGLVVLRQLGTPAAPSGVNAAATSDAQVQVTWSPSLGATSYQVYRRGPGESFGLIGTSTDPSFADDAIAAGTAYLYRVRAVGSVGPSEDSTPDLATALVFTDDPFVVGATPIKAVHLMELRTAVLAVRTVAGLPDVTFFDDAVPGVTVRDIHVTQLRNALDAALIALSLPTTSYSEPITSGIPIKAVHFEEIRARVK
jgi:hypothetical protein